MAPKVSPLKGMSVADWVKKKSKGWQQKTVNALIKTVKAAAPGAVFEIKWGQPVFSSNGPLGWIRPAKEHVTLGFWRGAELDDPNGVLEGGARMKHLKVGEGELDAALVKRFVRQAVALNAEKGDPTRR